MHLHRPVTSERHVRHSEPHSRYDVPRAATAEGGRRCRHGAAKTSHPAPSYQTPSANTQLPPACGHHAHPAHGHKARPPCGVDAAKWTSLESIEAAPAPSEMSLGLSGMGVATPQMSFDDHPTHTRNMMREREAWRVERDSHDKRRKKLQQQVALLGRQGKEMKARIESSEQQNQALRCDLAASEKQRCTAEKGLARQLEANRCLQDDVAALVAEIQRLRCRAKPSIRDSDLLRQVRGAERRIAALESVAGGGGAAPQQQQHSDFKPLLTPDFLGLFDVAAPIGCGSTLRVNGADWLQEPPAWDAP